MADLVKLVGLDFGTTTSSAVIAAAQLRRDATGRMDLDFQQELFRSELAFTPLRDDDCLDLAAVEAMLDAWLAAGQVQPDELFGGGALLTGLTAQKENAPALVALIRRRLGDALVATADDPCLESWLAFMGSCAELSRQHPDKRFLNFDIGGGTTNIALGKNRQVQRTGCLFLGARHVQVVPGSYRIVKMSRYARPLFDHLHIAKGAGDDLTLDEVASIVTFCVTLLEGVCTGKQESTPIVHRLEQVRFQLPPSTETLACASGSIVVTFSGGVGELIYRHLHGEPWPATTHYGDLGIDLARRITQSPVWAESLQLSRPSSAGRATVYGLLRHTTEVSGNTLFLGAKDMLPLADMPILGSIGAEATEAQVRDVLTLVRQSSRGGCVRIRLGSQEVAVVRNLGQLLAKILHQDGFPPTHPLVLLVQENVGKVLGQYVTRWGALPLRLLVIDELALRDAQYAQIGAPRDQVVPVAFYGFHQDGVS